MKSIGQFIAVLRKANGMTQQDVADKLNVSNKAVSRWERDECAPDLSLIPALAEMFNVSCDELLKGERIVNTGEYKESSPKSDKRLKSLINRELARFKNLIYVSAGISLCAFIVMLAVCYGFYMTELAFGIMAVMEVAAVIICAIAINRLKAIKTDNELFDGVEQKALSNYNKVLGNFSYNAFFMAISVILLSLPQILFDSDIYLQSVVNIETYLTAVLVIGVLLGVLYFALKNVCVAYITEQPLREATKLSDLPKKLVIMDVIQISAMILTAILFVISPYFIDVDNIQDTLYTVLCMIGLVLILFNVIFFIIYVVRNEQERNVLLLPGIRNCLLSLLCIAFAGVHQVSFWSVPGEVLNARHDVYNFELLCLILVVAIIIVGVFKIIEVAKDKK